MCIVMVRFKKMYYGYRNVLIFDGTFNYNGCTSTIAYYLVYTVDGVVWYINNFDVINTYVCFINEDYIKFMLT